MSFHDEIARLSSKISFAVVQQYLTLRKWNRVATKRNDTAVLTSPDDDSKFDILLPLTRELSDYKELIARAIEKISAYEERSEFQILNDLLVPPADIARYGVRNDSTESGVIPLNAGFELFESAKKSLLSAASDVAMPSHFHKRMAYKEAVHLMDSCFLGQTERGSYVATIICPFIKVEDDSQFSLFDPAEVIAESFTRKTTKKLMSSIQNVKRAIEEGKEQRIVEATGAEMTSANFLQSLVEMNEFTQKSTVEISMTWAPTLPPPVDVPSMVAITNDYIDPIRSIIDKITPEIVEAPREYVGKISEVRGNPDVDAREWGDVIIVFIGDDEKATTAKVTLYAGDLHNATLAFDTGKNVKIRGKLRVQNRQRIIEDPIFSLL